MDPSEPDLQSLDASRQDDASISSSAIAGPAALSSTYTASTPGLSALTEMIRKPHGDQKVNRFEPYQSRLWGDSGSTGPAPPEDADNVETGDSEQAPLLGNKLPFGTFRMHGRVNDVEGQFLPHKGPPYVVSAAWSKLASCFACFSQHKSWDKRSIWQQGVVYPASLLPAVLLGLLLNILDALSYGMILFPIGEAVFSDLGSDGIALFYVSSIICQLVFSFGASGFKGGVGSEMIEVVPFFHKMAYTVLARVGEDDPKSVLATTILSFALSSILTGLVFSLMGTCKIGLLIGFFPRHILIGCIGGVGWFLVATAIEVSARLPTSLEYDLPTLQKLFQLDTVFLWLTPLLLAIFLLVLKRYIRSNFLVGAYFIALGATFYLVKLIARVPIETLRDGGWVFDAPSAATPWYHFYTLYGQ